MKFVGLGLPRLRRYIERHKPKVPSIKYQI